MARPSVHGRLSDAVPPRPFSLLRLAFLFLCVAPFPQSLVAGLMMGFGTLLTRYLWGRYVAGDIPAGQFVPRAMGQKMVVDSVDAQGHAEKVLVEAHHIDTTSEAVAGAVSGAVGAGLAPTISMASAEMAAQPMPTTAPAASVAAAAPAAAGGASKAASAGNGRA